MIMGFLYSKYIITCKNVIKHSDGTLTFERSFEKLIVPKVPSEVDFNLVVGFEHSLTKDEDLDIYFEMTDPYDETMAEGKLFTLEAVEDNKSTSVVNITKVKNVPIKKSGLYSMYIKHNNKIICKQDVLIRKRKGEENE